MNRSAPIDRRRLLRMSALGGAGLIVGPSIASALGAARVSASGTTEPAALTDLNVQLGWLANVENAGEFVAANRGFYADEGLNPTLTPGWAGSDPRADRRVRGGADRPVVGRHDRPRQRRGRRTEDRRRHVATEPVGGDVARLQPGA